MHSEEVWDLLLSGIIHVNNGRVKELILFYLHVDFTLVLLRVTCTSLAHYSLFSNKKSEGFIYLILHTIYAVKESP
jgi:hypothetical protein